MLKKKQNKKKLTPLALRLAMDLSKELRYWVEVHSA